MYLVDFIYDDIKLSDLGCMVGSAVTSNNDTIEMGADLSLTTLKNRGSYLWEMVNADYDEVYTCQFDIIKKPCSNYDEYFSDNELAWFMRWLNRKEYCKFRPILDEEEAFYNLFFTGTFTSVQSIMIGGKIIGLALTFTSNSPFGYLDYTANTFTLESADSSFTIYNESEEMGNTYPKLFEVTCNSDGDLTISNSMDPSSRETVILNCKNGEVITFDCIHKVITSSLGDSHTYLYNDFNYNFPRLVNTKNKYDNVFTISLPCKVVIDYNPVRKVGAFV